jgi:hypothetical protein
LVLGESTIGGVTPTAAATIAAQGGAVTFGANKISGSGAGARLVPHGEEDADPARILVGTNGVNGQSLTLSAVDLDLQTAGGVVIAYSAGTPTNKVILASGAVPGKITFNAGSGSPIAAGDLTVGMGIGRADNLGGKPGSGIIVSSNGLTDGDLISASGGLKSVLVIESHITALPGSVSLDPEEPFVLQ